jgi:hypothetical protein
LIVRRIPASLCIAPRRAAAQDTSSFLIDSSLWFPPDRQHAH